MAEGNAKITYEENEDILSLWRGKPSKASIEVGDFIIDVDSQSFISGLEILNASENLNLESSVLSRVEKASMSVTYKQNHITIILSFKIAGRENNVSIPLTINLGHKKIEKEQIVFSR